MMIRNLLRRRQQFLCNLCKRIDEAAQLFYPLQDLQSEFRGQKRGQNSCAMCDLLRRALVEFAGTGVGEVYEELVLLKREIGCPMRADLMPLEESELKVRN
jgi:hypothetical protein